MSISQKELVKARSATVKRARELAQQPVPKTAADLEVTRHATYPTTAGEEIISSVVGPGLNGARWIALKAEVVGESTRVGFARLP